MVSKKKEWQKNISSCVQIFLTGCCITVFFLVILFFIFSSAKSLSFSFKTKSDFSFFKELNFKSFFKCLLFTLAQALSSTLLALLFGLFASYFVSHKSFLLRKVFLSFATVPLCLPAIVMALGYIATFGFAGIINEILMKIFSLENPPLKFLYSFWGLIVCQGFYNFPLVMVTVAREWMKCDKRQANAARLLGSSEKRIFFTITLNQLLPAIFSSCIPVFIYCFFSFMIASLFAGMDGNTLELLLYYTAKVKLDFKKAGLIALVQTLLAFLILYVYAMIESKGESQKETVFLNEKKSLRKIRGASLKEKILFGIFIFITFTFFVLPFLSILILSFTKNARTSSSFSFLLWKKIFSSTSFWTSLKNTFLTAWATSTLSTSCGFFYAVFLRTKKSSSKNNFLKTLALLPMAVSSVMMGLGASQLFKNGNFFILVLAQTALNWPFAFRQIYASLVKIPDETLNAARLLDTRRLNVIFKIILPYSLKSILNSLGLTFALSAGDATLPLTLSLRNFTTLSLYTYRLASSYKLNEACACGLILAFICMTIFLLARKGGRIKK